MSTTTTLEVKGDIESYEIAVDMNLERTYHFRKLCKERKKKHLLEITFEHWTRPIYILSSQNLNVLESNHCICHLIFSLNKQKTFREFASRNAILSFALKHDKETKTEESSNSQQ